MLFRPPELDPSETRVVREIEQLRESLTYAMGQPKRWFGLLRRNTFARNVRGSNTIEGYNVTKDDAVAAVENEEPIDPKDEAWMAVTGYREAMTYVLQKAEDPFFVFSPELLKALHFMMLGYDLSKRPGRWRPGPIFIRDEATGEQVYEGPPMEMVPGLVAELHRGNRSAVGSAPGHSSSDGASQPRDDSPVLGWQWSDGSLCCRPSCWRAPASSAPIFSSIEEYLGRNTAAVLRRAGGGGPRSVAPRTRFATVDPVLPDRALPASRDPGQAHARDPEALRRAGSGRAARAPTRNGVSSPWLMRHWDTRCETRRIERPQMLRTPRPAEIFWPSSKRDCWNPRGRNAGVSTPPAS